MVSKKVILVGSFGVGKTSLIRRFVVNEFSEDYISTIGVRISSKVVKYKDQLIKLLIWDVAGVTDREKIPTAYFLGSSAAMYVFDLSRIETYVNIDKNIEEIKKISGLNDITVVGNKKDLLSPKDLLEIESMVNVDIDFLTSAKENDNVEAAFELLGEKSLM